MIFILGIKDQENQVNIQDDLYRVIAIPVLEFIFLLLDSLLFSHNYLQILNNQQKYQRQSQGFLIYFLDVS